MNGCWPQKFFFLECSNKKSNLEITIVELKKENQQMMEELCQVKVLCLLFFIYVV